ncbi:MAG TPA: hypothetical protein VFS00_31585, partial [Polyangiaceae bacterium]|nr:hypothetical protein [Polyangiaceae bacterium]
MSPLAVLVGAGACTSVGLGARQTGFLLRTGAAGMAASPLLDRQGERVTMCLVPTLDPLLYGPARALELASTALLEALAPLREAAPGLRAKLVVALDESSARRGADGSVPADEAVACLRRRALPCLPELRAEALPGGPAGLGALLPSLCDELGRGAFDLAVVGGAHTDYDPATVAALESQHRLYSPANPNAVLPGEGAAFVVLARPELARRLGLPARAQLLALGAAHEAARPDNDEPAFRAAGATVAVRKALAPLAARGLRIGWMLSDVNFELYRLHEWQALMVRTSEHWCEPCQLDAPGQRLGHLGAATLPLHLALACTAWRHGYA